MTTTTKSKLCVWAPRTAGVAPSIVGQCDTMAEAREIAARYESRRDLTYQDVTIRLAATGKTIERCGPAR